MHTYDFRFFSGLLQRFFRMHIMSVAPLRKNN